MSVQLAAAETADVEHPAERTESVTPTLRARAKASRYWIFAGLGAVAIAIGSIAMAGGLGEQATPLAADNAAPSGALALVEVLRQHGVNVTTADTLGDVTGALELAPQSTVFFNDPGALLTPTQLDELLRAAPRLVVARPGFELLDALGDGVGNGGTPVDKTASAGCALPAAERAASVTVTDYTLKLSNGAGPVWTGCFDSGDGGLVLVHGEPDSASGNTVSLVSSGQIFANETITSGGNAALALNLLGESGDLVWYLPTQADVAANGPPDLAELTPGWLTPLILLLGATALAAMVWQGRRLGPLVAERLPVVVKSGETMEGRARLYARQAERPHAIDAIRMASIVRLARALALPRTLSADAVSDAVAALLGRDPLATRALLISDPPRTDTEMVHISDALRELESAVLQTLKPQQRLQSRPSEQPASPPASSNGSEQR